MAVILGSGEQKRSRVLLLPQRLFDHNGEGVVASGQEFGQVRGIILTKCGAPRIELMRTQSPAFWPCCSLVGAFAILNFLYWPVSTYLSYSAPLSIFAQMFLVGLVAGELVLVSLVLSAKNSRWPHLRSVLIAAAPLAASWVIGSAWTALAVERFVGHDIGQLAELLNINVEAGGLLVLGAALPVAIFRHITQMRYLVGSVTSQEERRPLSEDLIQEFIFYGTSVGAIAVITCLRYLVSWQPADQAMTFLTLSFFGGCLASLPICATALLMFWKPAGWLGFGIVAGAWTAMTIVAILFVVAVTRMAEAMYSGGHIDMHVENDLAAIVGGSGGCFAAVAIVLKLAQANGLRIHFATQPRHFEETG